MADINVTMEVGGIWDLILPPITNQVFSGAVDLTRLLTHYAPLTISSNLAIIRAASPAILGGAEVLITADGSHTPTFDAAFTKHPDSDDWLVTLGIVHKIFFYYDGTYTYYLIKIIS
jgi:hypothetical protein